MGAPAARVGELSSRWVGEGHDVTVLTGFPNHPTGRLAKGYRGKLWRLMLKENVNGIKVVRTWLLPFPNRKTFERLLNYSSFCASSSLTGLFLSRPDVVIATSPQLLVGLSGWWLARFRRVPFVFEVRDLWPESLVAVGVGDERSMMYRCLAAIANFLYRRADRIVVVTEAFKDYLVEKKRIAADKIVVVQNGVETDLFDPASLRQTLKSELGLERKFVVSYIGTMGMAHGLEKVLEAAMRLQETHPGIAFLFVGEGADRERLISLAGSMKLRNVRFEPEQSRERIPHYICSSDVCLVLLKKREIFKTVIPTKMLEFMACARPVILGVDGQARKIIENAKAGIFVSPESASDLIEAVVKMASDPVLCAQLGHNGRKYVQQHFSRQQTARIYGEFLERLLGIESAHPPVAA